MLEICRHRKCKGCTKSDKWVTSLTQFSGQIVKLKVHYRAIKIELTNSVRRCFTSLIYKLRETSESRTIALIFKFPWKIVSGEVIDESGRVK